MRHALLIICALAACKKQEAAPPAPEPKAPQISNVELKRGTDACADYVAKVCACTTEPAKQACGLAKALPEAIEVGLQVADNPESERLSILQANDSIRKTIRTCIEQVVKLPSLGC